MKPLRQPKTLTLDGARYRLVQPWKAVTGTISEGPFYRRTGEPDSGWLYLPDAGFLHTASGKLAFMHRISA